MITCKTIVAFASLSLLCFSAGQAGGCHRKQGNSKASVATNQTTKTDTPSPQNMNDSKSKDVQSSDGDETWGGAHVQLLMTANGAEVEFDCARGRLNSKIKPDTEGNFDVEGTFRKEGGPIRTDQADSGRVVRYVGKIVGDTMSFKIQFSDSNQKTETFSVTRGKIGRLWKCR